MAETDQSAVVTVDEAKRLAADLRRDAREVEKAAGIEKASHNEYHRKYMQERLARERDIIIRKPANLDRRLERLDNWQLFFKGYFADRFFRPFSNDQIEAVDTVIWCAKTGADEILAAPRGDWKTETCKALMVYLILNRLVRFPVIFGNTTAEAKLKYLDVKTFFDSPLPERKDFQADFSEICDPVLALDGSTTRAAKQTYQGVRTNFEWKSDYCTLPYVVNVPGLDEPSQYGGSAFTYRGMDGAVRGINLFGLRPDFSLLDDLETAESARSPHQIIVRESILDSDVAGLSGGGERVPRVVIGTVQNDYCLTHKKLNEWGGKRFKAIYEFPTRMDLWHEYIDIRRREKKQGSKDFPESHQFFVDRFEEMIAGAVVANEHRISSKKRADGSPLEVHALQNIMNDWADKGERYVMTELQNDPPKSMQMQTLGLSADIVTSRINGLEQRTLPKQTEIVSYAVDLGKDRCYWVGGGFVQGFTGWIHDYGVIEVDLSPHARKSRDAAGRSLYQSLMSWAEDLLQQEIVPDVVGIDSGNFTDVAYQFVKDIGGEPFRVCKGQGTKFRHGTPSAHRFVGSHWYATLQQEAGVWLVNLDDDHWKKLVQQLFLTEVFDSEGNFNPASLSLFSPGLLASGAYDRRQHHSFGKHIVSEEFRTEFAMGKGMISKWFVANRNNHWLDATYMMLAMAGLMGIELDFGDEVEQPIIHRPDQFADVQRLTGPGGVAYLASQRGN